MQRQEISMNSEVKFEIRFVREIVWGIGLMIALVMSAVLFENWLNRDMQRAFECGGEGGRRCRRTS